MGKYTCGVVGGLSLLLAGGGAMADDLRDCRKAFAKRAYDVAIVACTKAEASASIPADAAMAGALRTVSVVRRDIEGRAGSVPLDDMVRDPDADPRRRGDEEIVVNRSLY